MATATCPHGFARSSCLICQTLGIEADARPGLAERPERGERPAVEVLSGRPRRRRGLGARVVGLAALAVAGVLVFSWVTAVVWAVLRVLELVAVAVVAGYGGFKVGVHHGRRHPR